MRSFFARRKISSEPMREIGGQPDICPPPVVAIGLADDEAGIAELLKQPERGRSRKSRRDAGGTRRYRFALAFVNEKVDQNVPGRLAEQPVRADELATQQPASSNFMRVFQREAGLNSLVGAVAEPFRRPPSRPRPAVQDHLVVAARHHDMLQQIDIERVADRDQPFGDIDIAPTRIRVAAGMVVDKNDRGCIEFKRAAEYDARMDCQLTNCPILHLLVGNHAPCRIEKQHAENLKRKSAHRCLQILNQLGIPRRNGAAGDFRAHRFERCCARSAEHRDDGVVLPENPPKRSRRLGPETRERAILREQGVRYRMPVRRIDRGDEISQDGSLSPRASRRR